MGNQKADLSITQDPSVLRLESLAERIGWGAIALIIVAAGLGLFGSGPLSSARAASDDGSVSIEYRRFWRISSPMQIRIEVAPPIDGVARLWIDRDYLDALSVSRIVPQPQRVEAAADRVIYMFPTANLDGQPLRLTIDAEFTSAWRIRGAIGLEGAGTVQFDHFVYP